MNGEKYSDENLFALKKTIGFDFDR
jgi:hypothetical protein